jgi:hypothetical protein
LIAGPRDAATLNEDHPASALRELESEHDAGGTGTYDRNVGGQLCSGMEVFSVDVQT